MQKTGRLVIMEDDFLTCGAGAEIIARVMSDSELFQCLKAPVERIAVPDISHPYSPTLKKAMFPDEEKLAEAVRRVCK